ncbi:hypothetical protein [Arthrobacter sp. H41]|uniref:hypothetical protein n=1 Tax=Arthrobacter sp. H41 TaxID=1312978 RepID=UPI0012DDDD03|nr:hypothetical protein [Arthrobacter sp. H41]
MIRRSAVREAVVVPRAVLTLLGLTFVIAGILAMHVWMGGHGSTSHHLADPPAASSVAALTTAAHADAIPHAHSGGPAVQFSANPTQTVVAAITLAGASVEHTMAAVCAGGCDADGMSLGMCVLALILMGALLLSTPVGRALATTLLRRGPPAVSWKFRPAPTPSLTYLCISRT